jgi:lysophospholipase L1-like esterase
MRRDREKAAHWPSKGRGKRAAYSNGPVTTRAQQRSFALAIAAALLLLQEALFRAVFPLPEVANFNRMSYSVVPEAFREAHPALMNAQYLWLSEPDGLSTVQSLNLYGFRDARTWRVGKQAGTSRVMFVGDSFVEGVAAADDETITAAFTREAQRAGERVETMNLGVSGANIPEYFPLIRDTVPLFRPDALVLLFYANDFPAKPLDPRWLGEPPRPAFHRPWVPRLAHVLDRAANGEIVPRRWHARPFPFFRPVPDPANPMTSCPPGYEAFVEPALVDAMRRGTLNPNLLDHLGVVEPRLSEPIVAERHLEALQAFTRRHATRLFIGYLPHPMQVSDRYLEFEKRYSKDKAMGSLTGARYQVHAAALASLCTTLAIPFIDLTPLLREEEAKGTRLFWDYDNHMRGAGYQLVGKTVHRWWIASRG